MNIPFSLIHKKINISSSDVDWEHEQFSRKRIVGATLSSKSSPSLFLKSNLFDVRSRVNVSRLERNIKFIGESLAKYIYNYDLNSTTDFQVFDGSLQINHHFVESWLSTITLSPIVIPYLTKLTVLDAIQKVLGEYTESKSETFSLETEYIFYDGITTTMYAYKVKPVVFDIILTLFIVVYLFLLALVLKGPSQFWLQLKDIFKRDKKNFGKKLSKNK